LNSFSVFSEQGLKMKRSLLIALLGITFKCFAEPPLAVPVTPLGTAPTIDGDLDEWGKTGWIKVAVAPALSKADRAKYSLDPNDDKNQTGKLTVLLKAATVGDRFFVAMKYPDSSEDTISKPWELRGDKYVEGKQREDMFAIRFHMKGNFDRSMLSTNDYTVDVWLWSAAHTNPGGVAEDMMHHITTNMLDSAAEYESPDKKTIFIKKTRDEGTPSYKRLPKPKANKGDKLPSFELTTSSGSAADVAAKGRWKAGYWQLEFSRALNTGNADDVAFKLGEKTLGQIAVFNQGYAEHKSVSEPLMFDFQAPK
jgi:hypothetical protein